MCGLLGWKMGSFFKQNDPHLGTFDLMVSIHMGPEHASREKKLSIVNFLFSCTKMYIDLDSKRSKSGIRGF